MYAHGADVYLPKPLASEALLTVVANLGQRIKRQMTRVDMGMVLNTSRLLVKGPIAQIGLTQAEVV